MCPLCSKELITRDQLSTHINSEHDGEDGDWTCYQCEYQTNSLSNLKVHFEETGHNSNHTDSKDLKFRCKVCALDLKTKTDLNLHLKENH